MRVTAPTSEAQLLERAYALAGRTLGDLSEELDIEVPQSSTRGKGFAGTLLELALGATARSKPEPDFQLIGVELKTLPIDAAGKPRESTYVCTVPLIGTEGLQWRDSTVYHKLARVLWVPILVNPEQSIEQRTVATPLIWSPDEEEEETLRRDWEELMDMIVLDGPESITAHIGTWLQIRPKAADSRARSRSIAQDGAPGCALPLGFYLRTRLTKRILQQHYLMP